MVASRALDETTAMYSEKKNIANFIPAYSVKYPATISLSPSGKSNGMRFDSATAEVKKRMNASG
jgi:hypothetical protein